MEFDMNPTPNQESASVAMAGNWIGRRPSTTAITAVLTIGSVGMMMCGVQPVLLGTLVQEQRLSAAGLGWTTTAEFLALGIGIMAAGALLKPVALHMRV